MIHKLKPQIIEIPATIAFQPTPCTWLLGEGAQFLVHQTESSGHPKPRSAALDSATVEFSDVWSVRSTFLTLRHEDDFLAFLNQTGYFFREGTYASDQPLRLSDFAMWQRVFTGFLLRRPLVWEKRLDLVEPNGAEIMRAVRLHRSFNVALEDGREALFVARNTFSAILASIYIDHLRRAKFRLCARPDCRKPYEIESHHLRRYCTQYCASFQSLRRKRAQEKKRGEPRS
jgi:hypothetical protein